MWYRNIIITILLTFPTVALGEIIPHCALIKQAKKFGALDPKLVLAVVQVESTGNSKAMNEDQYGLMQIKLSTARMLGFDKHPKELLQWKTNLKLGIKYLNEKLRKYKIVQAAAAAYNAGKVYIKWARFVNQDYVDLVMFHYKKYKNLKCS